MNNNKDNIVFNPKVSFTKEDYHRFEKERAESAITIVVPEKLYKKLKLKQKR